MEIDTFLPKYDYHEVHSANTSASPEATYVAAKELLPSDLSPLVCLMLSIRELPAKLLCKPTLKKENERPFLTQLLGEEFMLLADSNQEIVFGLIGQFWKLTGGASITLKEPQSYLDFNSTGYAKVAANLAFRAEGENTILSTETRIWAPDEKTRKKFAIYWGLISFGSGWIRIMWLNAIKRRAEKV